MYQRISRIMLNYADCIELRQSLGIEDTVKVVQETDLRIHQVTILSSSSSLSAYVLGKDDDDWVKRGITLEDEEGPGKHGRSLWTRIWMIYI